MAVTKAWDETLPQDADALSIGDDEIRDMKQALRERLRNGGIKWGVGGGPTTDVDDGKLTCGVQGTTGILSLVENEAGTIINTIRDGTDVGGLKQWEIGDAIGGSEQYDLRSHDITARDFNMSGAGTADFSPGTLTMAANTVHTIQHDSNAGSLTLTGTYATVDTATAITTKSGTAGPILIMWSGIVRLQSGGSANTPGLDIKIQRQIAGGGFTDLQEWIEAEEHAVNAILRINSRHSITFVDTTATAGAVTDYRIQARENAGTAGPDSVAIQALQRSFVVIEFRND